jgi:hypothetical protein
MFTEAQRTAVQNVIEKKRRDPLYRPSLEEKIIIDTVLKLGIEECKVADRTQSWGVVHHG